MGLDIEGVQKCLLIGRWDSQLSSCLETYPAAKLAKAVVDGDFRTVLTSSYAQEIFRVHSSVTLDQPYKNLFQWTLPSVSDDHDRELIRLILGVACLHAFVQANWTGPDLNVKPSDIIIFPPDHPSISDQFLNSKAVAELAYGGAPAYHLALSATFFRFAQIIFGFPHDHLTYARWWSLRASIIHEQLLDEAVPLPSDILGSLPQLMESTASDPDLAGRLQLEQGLLEHIFSHDRSAAGYFVRAARATGLQYELTGALGKRTKFQKNELSQLVLLAEGRKRDGDEDASATETKSADESNGSHPPTGGSYDTPGVKPNLPETLLLNDDTLLEQTEFTSSNPSTTALLSHLDPSSQPPLHPLDQCILLSLCLNVRNTSPSHGLTSEQMSPYVARVISHPRNWSVHTMALLLRSRLESGRTRTVERSTLQLQALVDQMPTADSELSERLRYFHSIPLPSKWEMERELALRYLSIGVVKSALEIFERLEMWEEVVKCWQAMERPNQAIAIVRDLLEGRKEEADSVISKGKDISLTQRVTLDSAREAKLWCLLGDLEPENAVKHYEHAWTLSKETSGRAMRSLGGYYFARGDFASVVPCLLRAVAINPLLSRSWFILGCSYIRLEKWEAARDVFSRCVAIDDEDAESWNNLATMYLRIEEARQKSKDGQGSEVSLG
jgi:tetratricopeptide (TPR) repeat protein